MAFSTLSASLFQRLHPKSNPDRCRRGFNPHFVIPIYCEWPNIPSNGNRPASRPRLRLSCGRCWPRLCAIRSPSLSARPKKIAARPNSQRECVNFCWSGLPPMPTPAGSSVTSGLGISPCRGRLCNAGKAAANTARRVRCLAKVEQQDDPIHPRGIFHPFDRLECLRDHGQHDAAPRP
jgi:hypothetical protein